LERNMYFILSPCVESRPTRLDFQIQKRYNI